MQQIKLVWLMLGTLLAINSCPLFSADLTYPFAQSSLSGVVKSEKGAPLEGVVVRARRGTYYIAYDVISDAQGKYRFPKLEPGKYIVEIARADGLEPGSQNTEIRANGESRVDFVLGPAKDMEAQITVADWLLNLPGKPQESKLDTCTHCGGSDIGVEMTQQAKMISDNCTHCHTETLRNFRFDKENWAKIARFMLGNVMNYPNWSRPSPDRNKPGFEEKVQVIAEYLSQIRGPKPIDMSNAKIPPRPTGRSTHAMFTEYTVPYPKAELHDVAVDKFGTVWWTDWRWPYIGRLNPQTGEMKYWETPPLPDKDELHPGSFEITFDENENPWTAIVWTGGLLKFDRKTEKMTTWSEPSKKNLDPNGEDPYPTLQGTTYDLIRGRIWYGLGDDAGYYVPKTGEHKEFSPFPAYGQVTDSKGNTYGMLMKKPYPSHIGRIDAETGKMTQFPTPTPNAYPRRGDYDAQDRIWFTEYNAGQIALFDPATNKITEWKIDLPMSTPYGIGVDRKNDEVWAVSYRADRMVKFDTRTKEMVQYYLPARNVMSRAPRADPSSTADHSVVWVGTLSKYGNGKVIKMETW